MNAQPFNAALEVEVLRQKQKIRRRRMYRRSCLQKYRAEIVALLKTEGSSYRLVAEWLKTKKHFSISHTSIMRFAKKLPELQETAHAQFPQT